jgi:hypothetical protein
MVQAERRGDEAQRQLHGVQRKFEATQLVPVVGEAAAERPNASRCRHGLQAKCG